MKILPVFLFAAMVLFTHVSNAQSKQELLTEAQRDYLRGDADNAKQKFKMVLESDPRNVTAQNYLRMIAVQEKSGNGAGQLEKQLQALILPRVELKDATFGTALEYLKQNAAKVSEGKTKVSFVVQVPADIADSKKVTLSLTNVPFTEVLRYMGELTGFRFAIEKYAIFVKEKTGAPSPSAQPAPLP
jgi:hypothetical protein